jgi:hypothetical protein
MIKETINGYESEAIIRRLKTVRVFLSGENQAAFARELGIIPTRWNNFERGKPLTMRVAFLIVRRVPGLTVSYLTHGLTGDMPPPLRRQLGDLEAKLFPSRGKRSPKT